MLANPEFVRNVRSQLRPAKIVTAIIIAAALSLVVGFALTHITAPAAGRFGWGVGLLHMLFWVQALILAAGGGIACVNAIYKEKEQNTFDYQRLTRLSPLELTLGKLFGAPIFMYFLCACMLPLVVFAAIRGRQSIAFVLAGYVALLVGSLAFHALALLISLLIVRGAHTSAIVFVLVILALFSSIPAGISYFFQLGSLSPFYASHVVTQSSWSVAEPAADVELQMPPDLDIDVFFGRTVRHFPVMVVVDALLLAWLLLALCRNIKRDPHQYGKGLVAVVSAGTSDIPVAEEALVTAELMGNEVEHFYDVGVAGIHRLLANREALTKARVVIVCAGMEGALPSVVGGLVGVPVIAVPTSIGYGASFKGLTALLGMLNSCASNVSVVNIDNGFGAGYVASLINRL